MAGRIHVEITLTSDTAPKRREPMTAEDVIQTIKSGCKNQPSYPLSRGIIKLIDRYEADRESKDNLQSS